MLDTNRFSIVTTSGHSTPTMLNLSACTIIIAPGNLRGVFHDGRIVGANDPVVRLLAGPRHPSFHHIHRGHDPRSA